MYGLLGENCRVMSHQNGTTTSDSVQIVFPVNNNFQPQSEYCFIVTASNGTFTTMVEGLFPKGTHACVYMVKLKLTIYSKALSFQ